MGQMWTECTEHHLQVADRGGLKAWKGTDEKEEP